MDAGSAPGLLTRAALHAGDQEDKAAQQAVLLVADMITSLHGAPSLGPAGDDVVLEAAAESEQGLPGDVQQQRQAAAAKWEAAVEDVLSRVRMSHALSIGASDLGWLMQTDHQT